MFRYPTVFDTRHLLQNGRARRCGPMIERIVLSLFLALAACGYEPMADDEPPPMEDGIGTSPSMYLNSPKPCGIWVGWTKAEAVLAAYTRPDKPDVMQVTGAGGHTTCSDALAIAAWRWPDRSHVTYMQPAE